MRVIAGQAKGRRLVGPRGRRTRPTSDRVKEALFSMLQPKLPGASVLDLFAGSGALGIEALSRGAAHATFVERDRRALHTIEQNLDLTGLTGRATVVARDVDHVLDGPVGEAPFDLVFLDPPYDTPAEEVSDVLLALCRHLAPGATVTLERGHHDPPVAWPEPLSRTRERRYGDTVLVTATLDEDHGT